MVKNSEKKFSREEIFTVAPGVWGTKDVFVNMYMVQDPETSAWVLVDAGLKWSASKIKKMAEELFGAGSQPEAIILTHGHFDHIGSVKALAEEWNVPVYAHPLEMPYLTGKDSYPPGDPTVGGGLMSLMAFLYPKTPINIANHLKALPEDGSVPALSEWKYLHTPGHAPGHISLFRESDRVLIAGDAFVTTKSESVTSIMMQRKKVSGPPKYFTPDWESARTSVQTLFNLNPEVAATGHGLPMRGAAMKRGLYKLQNDFEEVAIPSHGRYIEQPAEFDVDGVLFIPPNNISPALVFTALFAVTSIVLVTFLLVKNSKEE